ncbi:uncharacterized protein K460DRAFT_255598, partial [Cucurbitaria berberidis CBS 394.84]
MATNAPYYQMHAGQFINATNSTNAAQPQFVPEDDEYDLSAATPTAAATAVVASSTEHYNPSQHTEYSARQTSADNTLEENHNLVELLEAATTARQAAQAMNVDISVASSTAAQAKGKRKRVSSSPAENPLYPEDEAISTKRRRLEMPTDTLFQEGDRNVRVNSKKASVPPTSESLLDDARAAGVHSAAALFRHSSERTSRKYTRPPMSKLFMSLQLSPENFLQLQAQAKAYMLDSAHPERQNCVGNRGKGDTDMVKLRLFNCVRNFLDDQVGEQFFGEHVKKPGEKEATEAAHALGEEKTSGAEARLAWPRDGNKIIGLVTPLMRRMVTNERQRQYAMETRKGGAKKKERDDSLEVIAQQANSNSRLDTEQLQPAFDPTFDQPPQLSQLASPSLPNDVMSKLGSLPGRYRNHPDRDRTTLAEAEARTTNPARVKLPTDGPAEHHLSHINIFLTLAPRGSRPIIKLDETRITLKPPQKHLAWYEWDDFLQHVIDLLQAAKAKFPEVRERLVFQEGRIGAENLRGLAVAANALSNETANGEDAALGLAPPPEGHHRPISQISQEVEPSTSGEATPANPDASFPENALSAPPPPPVPVVKDDADTDTNIKLLPRYIIKTIGPDGWKIIGNAKEWYDMLLEMAFAVWADGVCNVLVELVDL